MLTGEFECGPEKSIGVDSEGNNDKKKKSTYQPTLDEDLQERKDFVKEYLVINNRNWGEMSAMMLATRTHDRQIISHDICWKIIQKVWRSGKIRQQARILA